MIVRRDLILAGLGLGAFGAAQALAPRKRLKLLQTGTIEAAMPARFGNWTAQTTSDLVSPEQAGKLARSLYSEIISRIYTDETTGAAIMVLIAYGDTQSDLLQLHRPESCYPAVGFALRSAQSVNLPISPQAILPARRVVAYAGDRNENILYWARLGEQLPQTAADQRRVRLDNAMHGYVADGILVRFSLVGESEPSFKVLDDFVPAFLAAVNPATRPAMIGTQLARKMA